MKPNLPIHVALLDDHAVVRMGYEREIFSDTRLEIAGSFGRSADLLHALRQGTRVDVLLLDYALGDTDSDGVQLISMFRQQYPKMRILVASAHENPATVALVLRAGVHGFLGKGQPLHELCPAIYQVARGRRYMNDSLAERMPHIPMNVSEAAESANGRPESPLGVLSKREQEVMRCILDGMAVNDVAHKFSRSAKTISNQKQSAFKKLGIRTLVELAAYRDRLKGS